MDIIVVHKITETPVPFLSVTAIDALLRERQITFLSNLNVSFSFRESISSFQFESDYSFLLKNHFTEAM